MDLVGDATQPSARRFVLGFFATVLLVVTGFGAILAALDRVGMLPPPPLTANACMDEKFKFLAERDLKGVDLIAVGSSVTWRNLDMTAFKRKGLADRPLNAAPCYLHISETAYYAEFLLDHLPDVKTVVSVVAPRDFERCVAPKDAFFSAPLAGAYLFAGMPAFPLYLLNFVPHKFVRNVFRIEQWRNDPNQAESLVMDEYGSGPLHTVTSWLPEPAVAEMCFQALAELERLVLARGAVLVVITFPLQPEWRSRYDPQGTFVKSFETRVRSALTAPSTQFISGSQEPSGPLLHADAVHYVWDSAVQYSARLADAMAMPGHARGSSSSSKAKSGKAP
jgi:hypothetical protein